MREIYNIFGFRLMLMMAGVLVLSALPALAYADMPSIMPSVGESPSIMSPGAQPTKAGLPNIGGPFASALWVDVTLMLQNFAREIPTFVRFVVAISFTTGVCLVTTGLIKLKQFGHNTVMMSTHANVLVPMVYVLIGSMMIYFPTMLKVGSFTVFMSPTESLLSYAPGNAGSPFAHVMQVVTMIVQLVGYIAFLRGLFILMKIGSNHSPGTLGKGLVHLLGGVLAVNIMTTWAVLAQTLGFMTGAI